MLGSNVSTVGGLHRGFAQATQWGCDAIQIYTTPSRQWAVPPLKEEERSAFEEARLKSPVKVIVAHVPFLVNACAPQQEALQRSRERLITEIRRAADLSVMAVILHPGFTGGAPKRVALRTAAETIREALDATTGLKVRVLIENMAGQGSTLCATFEEIAELLAMIDAPSRAGVCFDTAHAFFAGYPLVGYQGFEEVVGIFDEIVGWVNVFAMHLNDAKSPFGSRHDRHAAIGEGRMGLQVFHAFIRDLRFVDLPLILEIPERDTKSFETLQLLRKLAHQETPLEESETGLAEQLSIHFSTSRPIRL